MRFSWLMLTEPLSAIRTARPGLSLQAQAVVEAVFLNEGPIGSSAAVAQHLGLTSRFCLGRLLEGNGLPSLLRLTHWALVFSWLARAEREGRSLCDMAFRSGRYPAACYRLVKKVTGRCWGEVRAGGLQGLLQQFIAELETQRVDAIELPTIRPKLVWPGVGRENRFVPARSSGVRRRA